MLCPRCKVQSGHKVLEGKRYYFECSNCQIKILMTSLQNYIKENKFKN
jgi:hypothetical protein